VEGAAPGVTPNDLEQLVRNGETLDVEFKGERARPLNDSDLIEAVVCLANRTTADPGYLLVGVEDDGEVTGARPRHGKQTDPHRLQSLVSSRTRPSITVRIDEIPIRGRSVIVLEIPPARSPVGTSDGRYLRRAIGGDWRPCCLPFHFHEMQAAQADRGLIDFTALVVPDATWDHLDALEFERFRRLVRESRGRADDSLIALTDVELAKALGAIEANHAARAVRVLGLLLFGREDALRAFIPCHEVAFQVLSGTTVQVNDFTRAPLLRTMEEMMARFRARNEEQEIIDGLVRIGVPDYPERAFREGLANALVHRDYTRLGAVHVQWQADSIVFSSPGGFPDGVRLDNLLVTPPRPRNPILADALKRAGVVERTARGIDTIFEEQLRNGRPPPSYARSTDSSVVLQLPGGPAGTAFVKLIVEEDRSGRPLRLDDLLLLHALREERTLTTDRAAGVIQKPEPEAGAVLHRLVEAGLVEPRGERRSRSYHLSAQTYRRLGEKAAYVRQRGFEPIQQEQMILQYVRKHGRITRREAAELCRISTRQARTILSRLHEQGSLVLEGTRRGAFYTASIVMDKSKTDMDKSKKSKTASKTRRSK